jgi:putative transposase
VKRFAAMSRHTAFKFCLDPTVEQRAVLARHAGAARFAFNQCLHMVKAALTKRQRDRQTDVPWSRFDLINAFNVWKTTADAGRVFSVHIDGVIEVNVTGLAWRDQVCQQVFEEAAVDCSRALAAWSDSRSGNRRGSRVGFPRFKKKTHRSPSFRIRNKYSKAGRAAIRVGETHFRSVTLPGVGTVRVHDDTRRLRRLLGAGRAKILFVTISQRGGRWWAAINVEAADLHPGHRHPCRDPRDRHGWVGIDRGLCAFLVAASADGRELARIDDAPKALARGMRRQRHLAKSLSRKQKGSHNRRRAADRLARHHYRVANVRRHFLHTVSTQLAKTHDRLVVENLNVAGMVRNRRLARAISDAGWAELARQLRYKAAWRGGAVVLADRWYPSSQICSQCKTRDHGLSLADRVFSCECGYDVDRDLNAAVNLAHWGEQHAYLEPRTRKHAGRVTNARRRDGSDQHTLRVGATGPVDTGTAVQFGLAT